jgi:3-dehydroquinate synthase
MPCDLTVSSSTGTYGISIGLGGGQEAATAADVVVVDANLRHLVPSAVGEPIEVVASEDVKTLAGVESLSLQLRARGVNRQSTMCAIGGGSIQDLATLTAALYMRGIRWTYVPTTLMAMADSCIGGKSAINAGGYKNLLGNFNPPSMIFVDPEVAATLPEVDLMCGVAEAVKICFVSGPEDFVRFVDAVDVGSYLDVSTIEALVTMALVAKKRIVEVDEFDIGERQLLNFGHTFGHALEAATGMALPHGLGVAIGMRAAVRHPMAGSTDLTESLDTYSQRLLERALSDGWVTPAVDWERFQEAFQSDKKHLPDAYRVVLPGGDGRLMLLPLPRTDASLAQCVEAARTAVEETR